MIRAAHIRVIGHDGAQLGVLSREEALRAAEEVGLDLVEVSPDANPPVAKIVDWGKYNYQKTKQLQKNKRNQKVSELKQIRFGLKISDHDIDVKLKKVTEFLDDGHKVRLVIIFRGRELAHKEIGFKLADRLLEKLGERIIVDQSAIFAGKQLSIVVRSQNAKNKGA